MGDETPQAAVVQNTVINKIYQLGILLNEGHLWL